MAEFQDESNAETVTQTFNAIASMKNRLPASFLQARPNGNGRNGDGLQLGVRDPQNHKIDWILPNYGQFPLSHILSFQSIVSSGAKVYRQYDEAIKNSLDNARYMRNDCGIMECLEARQRCVALLDWHIEPEDKKSPDQMELCTELTKILKRIRRFTEYRRVLLEAVWYGKYAVQHQYGWVNIGGQMRIMPKPRRVGQYGWLPINGDKLCFRFDDGNLPDGTYEDQLGIRVGMGTAAGSLIRNRWKVEPTDRGMAYFIDEDERRLLAVHKHSIEDAPYEDALGAGMIHGVGVRSRIYWEWVQKQETLAFLMEYLERCAGGIQLWKFPQGNPKAKEEAEKAAQEFTGAGRNVLMVPIPAGDEYGQYGVEVIEPGMAGIDMLHNILTSYFGHRIKRYILGQILSSEAEATGLGSGLADLHMDTLMQIIKYDATNLEETITFELLHWLKEWNFPQARNIHVEFKIDTESPDVEKKLEAWSKAYEMGCKLKEQDVMDLIGAAMPGEEDKVLEKQQPMDGDGMGGAGGMFGGPRPGAALPEGMAGGPTKEHADASDPSKQPPQVPAGLDDEGDDPIEGRGGPKDKFSEFHEADHPRDDSGKFITKSRIAAAKKDGFQAAQLLLKTTDPANREKLLKHLGDAGKEAMGTVSRIEKTASANPVGKPATKQPNILAHMAAINPNAEHGDVVLAKDLKARVRQQNPDIDNASLDRLLLDLFKKRMVVLSRANRMDVTPANQHEFIHDHQPGRKDQWDVPQPDVFYNTVARWSDADRYARKPAKGQGKLFGDGQRTIEWREEDHPRVPAGSEHGGEFSSSGAGDDGDHSSGEPRKFLTAGQAAIQGLSHANWTHPISTAYTTEQIPEDHPAWKSIQHGTAPSIGEFNEARRIYGQHVRPLNSDKMGKVTGIADDAKSVIVTHADGSTSVHSPGNLHHLGAEAANRATSGGALSLAKHAEYFGPQLASEAIEKNENISETMKRHGLDSVKHREIRSAISEAYMKAKEKQQSQPEPPSEARQRAMDRQRELQGGEGPNRSQVKMRLSRKFDEAFGV